MIQPMQPPTKLALAHHVRNVALFLQQFLRPLIFPAKEQRCHDRRCHHLGIAHLALPVFPMMQSDQQIGAQAVDEYNLEVHEFSPCSVVGFITSTLPVNSWIFYFAIRTFSRSQLGLIILRTTAERFYVTMLSTR